jgi:outer membrane protein TolC
MTAPPLCGVRAFAPALAAIIASSPGLSGCANPDLGAHHRALERSFAASAAPPPDPETSSLGPQLERDTLVRDVLLRNPSIEVARQAWGAALARYPQETSLDDPTLSYAAAPASFGSHQVDDGQRIEVSQKLPFPGKLSLRGEVALAEAEAASFEYEAARLRIGTMASLLFDDYTLAARSLEINAEHRRLLEDLHRIALARYEAGRGTEQDPLQAETESAEVLDQGLVLETRRSIVSAQINALLHRPPDAPLPPAPAPSEVPPHPNLGEEKLAADALQERPDLRAAQARVEAGEADVARARRDFLPDFVLSGGYDSFWQESDLRSSVGISIDVPLQLGRRRAALAEAEARLAQARGEEERLEDTIRLSVVTALARLREAHHHLEISRDRLLPAARDRVAAARAAFEAGRGSFSELIEAERTLRRAQLGYYEEIANLGRRRADLDRAVGKLAVASEPEGTGGQP